MHVDAAGAECHTDEIHSVDPEEGCQAADLPELGCGETFVDPEPPPHRPDLDDDPLTPAPDDEVHLAPTHDDVAVQDLEAAARQDRGGQGFAPVPQFPSVIRHGGTGTRAV